MSRAEGFAAIPNWMIRDRQVSRRAVLVYASLASRSGLGGIYPSQATIAEESGVSERTARTALAELEQLGVIERVRRTDSQGHRLPDGYALHPNGLTATSAGREALPAIPTGNQLQDAPLIEVEPDRHGERFDAFWSVYPRKAGKELARKAFATAVKKVGAEVVIAGARRFAADPNLPEKRFIPHPSTWLSRGSWDDEPLPPRVMAPAAPVTVREEQFAPGDEWLAFNR